MGKFLAASLIVAGLSWGQSPSKVELLARKIAKVEGYYTPGTLANRSNNPGAIVFANQDGAIPGAKDKDGTVYARFKTPEIGWRALEELVAYHLSRGTLGRAWKYLK